jgi:hypothetical protein
MAGRTGTAAIADPPSTEGSGRIATVPAVDAAGYPRFLGNRATGCIGHQIPTIPASRYHRTDVGRN